MSDELFENKVIEFIRRNNLLSKRSRVLVAVSGGIDSIALMNFLYEFRDELDIQLGIAHFNHKLRGLESDEDENFVRGIAAKYNIEFYGGYWKRDDKLQGSIQMLARKARFQFLNRIADENNYQVIALAHHLDDQAETILMNLMKGYGITALCGIQPKSDNRIHPFLSVQKREIEQYAMEKKLDWVLDSSNIEVKYFRNKIRNEVLPTIESVSPNFVKTLIYLSYEAADIINYIQDIVDELWNNRSIIKEKNRVILDINKIKSYFYLLNRFAIISALYALEYRDVVSSKFINEVINLMSARTGATISFKGIEIVKDRERLIFSKIRDYNFEFEIEIGEKFIVGDYELFIEYVSKDKVDFSGSPKYEYFDRGKISGKLVARSWQQGDYFQPLGMKSRVKLSDFLINSKIPLCEKKYIPIITDQEKIICVCGLRLDERVKIDKYSKDIVKLTCIRTEAKPVKLIPAERS